MILGYVGAMPAEGLYLLIAREAAYYFYILVVLPVLGFKERTLPIPLSITRTSFRWISKSSYSQEESVK